MCIRDRLFYFEPIPEEARAAFAERPLWQALPFVREGRVAALPPVWSFGGMMSAERLARVLGDKLAASTASSDEARSGQGVRHE